MFEHIQLPNPGLTRGVIPEDIYQLVMQEIREIEKDDRGIFKMNNYLAGHMEKEYKLEKSNHHIVPYLEEMGKEYQKRWDYSVWPTNPERVLKVDSIWVNLQKKAEYNPIHAHDGALSFVAWMDIPYKYEDEMDAIHSRDSRAKAFSGTFQFIYNSVLGDIVNEVYEVENGWEGRIVMFPAELRHVVYPFYTSDRYRISIAGNLS